MVSTWGKVLLLLLLVLLLVLLLWQPLFLLLLLLLQPCSEWTFTKILIFGFLDFGFWIFFSPQQHPQLAAQSFKRNILISPGRFTLTAFTEDSNLQERMADSWSDLPNSLSR